MFRSGSAVYIQIPDGSVQRVLHPAMIVGIDSGVIALELKDPEVAPEAGQSLLLYFDHRGEFMQQVARVGGVLAMSPRAVIGIEPVGKPISAESRQSFRVSTAMTELRADLGSSLDCKLLDVSAAGFAVIAYDRYNVGDILDAALHLEGDRFSGKVSVQSAKQLDDGAFRYGLYCVEEGEPGIDLASGLLRISVYVQREQLKRLARSA